MRFNPRTTSLAVPVLLVAIGLAARKAAAQSQPAPSGASAATVPTTDANAGGRLNHYLSLLNPRPTTQEYLAAKAKADAAMAEADRRSDEAWARALPEVRAWESKGKPYIPWAAKPCGRVNCGPPAGTRGVTCTGLAGAWL